MPHVLIIESVASAAEDLAALIAGEGCSVATAATVLTARAQIALHAPELVLIKAGLLEGAGLFALEELRALAPEAQFVLVGEEERAPPAASAARTSRPKVLAQPLNTQSLRDVLSRLKHPIEPNATARHAVRLTPAKPARQSATPSAQPAPEPSGESASLRDTLEREGHFGALWGRSGVMRRVHEQIERVSGTGVPVFLLGESGSGKELVARMVHDLSARRERAFLGVNCGAISPSLIESELFGHEKGAFTGAERQHQGFFERASGGTLFLDEITEMPLDLQVKLLRVLESGTFMRVGSTQLLQSNVRLIAASNRRPAMALAQGRLREDLLYRLNVFPIEMPALRERPEDITLLAEHFLQEICEREGQTRRFSREALARLCRHDWPGNVRELRNIVQRAYVMAQDELIEDACVPPARNDHDSAHTEPRAGANAGLISASNGGSNNASAQSGVAPRITFEIGTALSEVERQITLATLAYYGRHKERTAAALGVSLKTLYNRLKEYADPQSNGLSGNAEAPGHEAAFSLPSAFVNAPQRPARGLERRRSIATPY